MEWMHSISRSELLALPDLWDLKANPVRRGTKEIQVIKDQKETRETLVHRVIRVIRDRKAR